MVSGFGQECSAERSCRRLSRPACLTTALSPAPPPLVVAINIQIAVGVEREVGRVVVGGHRSQIWACWSRQVTSAVGMALPFSREFFFRTNKQTTCAALVSSTHPEGSASLLGLGTFIQNVECHTTQLNYVVSHYTYSSSPAPRFPLIPYSIFLGTREG